MESDNKCKEIKMEEWEEKLDIDIEKYKKRRKGYLISIIIILIIFTIIA